MNKENKDFRNYFLKNGKIELEYENFMAVGLGRASYLKAPNDKVIATNQGGNYDMLDNLLYNIIYNNFKEDLGGVVSLDKEFLKKNGLEINIEDFNGSTPTIRKMVTISKNDNFKEVEYTPYSELAYKIAKELHCPVGVADFLEKSIITYNNEPNFDITKILDKLEVGEDYVLVDDKEFQFRQVLQDISNDNFPINILLDSVYGQNNNFDITDYRDFFTQEFYDEIAMDYLFDNIEFADIEFKVLDNWLSEETIESLNKDNFKDILQTMKYDFELDYEDFLNKDITEILDRYPIDILEVVDDRLKYDFYSKDKLIESLDNTKAACYFYSVGEGENIYGLDEIVMTYDDFDNFYQALEDCYKDKLVKEFSNNKETMTKEDFKTYTKSLNNFDRNLLKDEGISLEKEKSKKNIER